MQAKEGEKGSSYAGECCTSSLTVLRSGAEGTERDDRKGKGKIRWEGGWMGRIRKGQGTDKGDRKWKEGDTLRKTGRAEEGKG